MSNARFKEYKIFLLNMAETPKTLDSAVVGEIISLENHKETPEERMIYSRLLLSNYASKFSEEETGDTIVHAGPETAEDREIEKRHEEIWKNKYRPQYEKECKRQGLPIITE